MEWSDIKPNCLNRVKNAKTDIKVRTCMFIVDWSVWANLQYFELFCKK